MPKATTEEDKLLGYLKRRLFGRSNEYKSLVDAVISAALKDPDGYSGRYLSRVLIDPNLIKNISAIQLQEETADADFEAYRIQKGLTASQKKSWPDIGNQHRLLNYSGRGWGKTALSAALIAYYCHILKAPALYLNKTASNAQNQLFPPLLDVLDDCNIDYTINKSEGTVNFKSGGKLYVGGHNDKASSDVWRGFEFALVILDEAFFHKGNIKYLIEDIVEPRMGKFPENLIVVTSTPPRAKVKYYESMLATWPSISYTMKDNEYMKNSWQLYDEKAVLNTNTIRREWMGLWEHDYSAIVWHKNESYPQPEHINYIGVGVDWGINDPTVCVILGGDLLSKKVWELYSVSSDSLPAEQRANFSVSNQIDMVKDAYNRALEFKKQFGVKEDVVVVTDTDEKTISRELQLKHGIPTQGAWKTDMVGQCRKLDDWLRTNRLFLLPDGPCSEDADKTVWKRDPQDDSLLSVIDDDVYHPNAMHALRYVGGHFQWRFQEL
jgi:hypothetical protein